MCVLFAAAKATQGTMPSMQSHPLADGTNQASNSGQQLPPTALPRTMPGKQLPEVCKSTIPNIVGSRVAGLPLAHT